MKPIEMTLRSRVLLFAALSVGCVALVGGGLFLLAHRGEQGLRQMLAIQAQMELYGRVTDDAFGYLHVLLHTSETGGDTQAVLEEQERRFDSAISRLQALVREEHMGGPATQELEHIEQLRRAVHRWMRSSEERVRRAPDGAAEALLLHDALRAFREGVAPHLERAWASASADLEFHKHKGRRELGLGRMVAVVVPVLALVLVLSLASVIYLNMRRALGTLLERAQRMGEGDLDTELPVKGERDEYDLMARAINRMAAQLRAAVRERERYNALLEQTVRERTSELEQTNARLTDSLQQLRDAQSQLLFADRLATVGQLAAGVGHELNNPLAFVLSNLNYAQQVVTEMEAAPTPVERRELLESLADAREGAERVRLIVRDLRMLSRPDDQEMGPVDLVKVVRSAAKMAAHEIRGRARLVQAVENVPPVHGSSARLCQVFLNLLINAAHAIAPGAVERNEIKLSARVDGTQRVTVEVRDTGSGIPKDTLERIFEPFFTTKPASEGSGLGLSVCKSIISAHGGDISVESEPGQGTTFRVSLPVYGGEARA
jgi:signal transduction histidine kinase